jgi:hypothetical protein
LRYASLAGLVLAIGCGGQTTGPGDAGSSVHDSSISDSTSVGSDGAVEASSDALSMSDSDAGDDCVASSLPTPSALYVSDPEATFEQTTAGFSLTKMLDGNTSYGVYDVLYTGQSAQWSFEIPTLMSGRHIKSAIVTLQMVADNHTTPIGVTPPRTTFSRGLTVTEFLGCAR